MERERVIARAWVSGEWSVCLCVIATCIWAHLGGDCVSMRLRQVLARIALFCGIRPCFFPVNFRGHGRWPTGHAKRTHNILKKHISGPLTPKFRLRLGQDFMV